MHDYRNSVECRVLNALNIVLMTLPFALSWMFYYRGHMAMLFYYKGNTFVILIAAVLYTAFCHLYEGFTAILLRRSEVVYSQGLAAFITNFLMYVILFLLARGLPALWPLLLAFLAQLCFSVLWVLLAHWVYDRRFSSPATALVYGSRVNSARLREKYRIDENFRITTVVGIDECLLNGFASLEDVHAVFIYGIYGYERDAVLQYCLRHKLTVYMLPALGDIMIKSTHTMHMAHTQLFRLDSGAPSMEFLAIKRCFDIASSLLAILILSPLLLITALAIKLGDGGPVLYRQCRLTKDGERFYILKFRSMRVDAEKDGVARLSTGKKDSRITPVGRVIRKYRIDELPQLFNILKGDMSVVGPRPERPEIAAQYESELPEFSMRQIVKAGLTGYAQVYGQYNTAPYDKLQMDLMYIANASFSEDLRIILATVKILFMPESTEGIDEGSDTAAEKPEARVLDKKSSAKAKIAAK